LFLTNDGSKRNEYRFSLIAAIILTTHLRSSATFSLAFVRIVRILRSSATFVRVFRPSSPLSFSRFFPGAFKHFVHATLTGTHLCQKEANNLVSPVSSFLSSYQRTCPDKHLWCQVKQLLISHSGCSKRGNALNQLTIDR